jgi:hypothetical protein
MSRQSKKKRAAIAHSPQYAVQPKHAAIFRNPAMKLIICELFLLLLSITSSSAQSSESYRGLLTTRVRSEKPPAPAHLEAYVQDGRLTLSLRDAILLALENNSNISLAPINPSIQRCKARSISTATPPPVTASCRVLELPTTLRLTP